jgi:hypothetical protein
MLMITRLTRPRLEAVIETQLGTEAMKKFVSTYDRAILEGRAQGKAEGKAEGRTELLLRQLQRRFGPLPRDVSDRLTTASIDDLDRWALRVLDAGSLDEVFAAE